MTDMDSERDLYGCRPCCAIADGFADQLTDDLLWPAGAPLRRFNG
ncbi:hypothetical protein [Streptomyces sp. RKAG337]|nr:hypothetical protein [Streptomyces sp. RKAG337]